MFFHFSSFKSYVAHHSVRALISVFQSPVEFLLVAFQIFPYRFEKLNYHIVFSESEIPYFSVMQDSYAHPCIFEGFYELKIFLDDLFSESIIAEYDK